MALLVPNCPSSRRFFRVRFDRLTPREQDYPSYGETAFTVTMFDRYMVPHKRGARLPACISGRRRCPPEDCGGVWGYEEMLESLADPKAEDHEHVKEWIGEDFDPEVFSARTVDRELGEMEW